MKAATVHPIGPQEEEERALPRDPEAEASLLGAVMLDAAAMATAQAEGLAPLDFESEAHAFIYGAMVALFESGEPIDPTTLRAELRRREQLERAGGRAYISGLIDGIPSVANVAAYIRLIKRASDLRRLAHTGNDLFKLATSNSADPDEISAGLRAVLDRIQAAGGGSAPGLPEPHILTDWLQEPDPPLEFRVSMWQTTDSRVLMLGKSGVGKTRLKTNLIRSLVDGDDWLGCHPVTPVEGRVVVLDLEMSPQQLKRWLRDAAIANTDKVVVLPLRGRTSVFNILDPNIRAEWAEMLRDLNASYVTFDCLRPALDAFDLDEHKEAGKFLVAFDALLDEAGVTEACIVHHHGHQGERARGDSRIIDWCDAQWNVVAQGEQRFISAFGRDVDQPECALDYDPETGTLTLAGGNRKDHASRGALDDVLEYLNSTDEPQSKNAVENHLKDLHPRRDVRAALSLGEREHSIRFEKGPRGAHLYSPARQLAAPRRQLASAVPNHFASSPIGAGEVVSEVLDESTTLARRVEGGR